MAALATIVAVFWPTFRDLLTLGSSSEQHTHRILVLPIFIAMVWARRVELSLIPPRVCWWAMAGLVLCDLLWLAGDLTFTRLFTEVAVITMFPFVILGIFGIRWLWTLVFPMAFLLFIVPVRGPLVALQVDLTARFTYAGLLATGIPVHREGPYFELPTGKWSIAAACSGIEYLSACMILATMYAWSMYSSWRKRALFIMGAMAVGVTGNWLRAYLTIVIAHVSDNRYLRDSHGPFGWMLFALLLFAYCLAGWYFRDQEMPAEISGEPSTDPSIRSAATSYARTFLAAVVALSMLCAAPVASSLIANVRPSQAIEISQISTAAGWVPVAVPFTDWTPFLVNPVMQRVQTFEKNARRVSVFIGVFAGQTWTSKLVTSVNDFVDDRSERWTVVERKTSSTLLADKTFEAKTAAILGDNTRITAWQWYWIDGTVTANDLNAKLVQLKTRLSGKPDTAAWVSVYTHANVRPEEAATVLGEFMRDMGQSLEASLRRTSQPGPTGRMQNTGANQ
ncbi:MAG: exosortase A [Betaproteobacteria bacterium]